MISKKENNEDRGLPDLPVENDMPLYDIMHNKQNYSNPSTPDPVESNSDALREPPPLSFLTENENRESRFLPPPEIESTDTQNQSPSEMNEWNSKGPSQFENPDAPSSLKSKKVRSTFIKLSKFHSAKKSLEVVKQKVSEIDSLLDSIHSLKRDETQELINWSRDIEQIKARLNLISSEIFEQPEED